MLVMFGGFGAYFLYDWKIGYPKKNYMIAHYQAFDDAGHLRSKDAELADQEKWASYVDSRVLPFQDEPAMYPSETDFNEKWPPILKEIGERNSSELWKEYSKEKGWPQVVDPQEDRKSLRKINEQLGAAAACLVLCLVTLFFLVRTKGRVMKVDDQGYYPPGGGLIPFSDLETLDKRKWESKGLATLTYRKDGTEKKTKIDGMVYGQFKEEDGAPAEALFQKILANFEGEIIEIVGVQDEDESEEGGSPEDGFEGADGPIEEKE